MALRMTSSRAGGTSDRRSLIGWASAFTAAHIFAIPPWKWHHHENATNDDVVLFSVDDWPAKSKLGFYLKEETNPSS